MRVAIWVYANAAAAPSFAPGATRALPVGSIIAKEKLARQLGVSLLPVARRRRSPHPRGVRRVS
jgi:hypothetical protein